MATRRGRAELEAPVAAVRCASRRRAIDRTTLILDVFARLIKSAAECPPARYIHNPRPAPSCAYAAPLPWLAVDSMVRSITATQPKTIVLNINPRMFLAAKQHQDRAPLLTTGSG